MCRVLAGLLVLGGLLSAPSRVFANDIYADLDHDGIRDLITIDPTSPSGIVIWLSASRSTLRLPTRRPIVRIAAADLDGDGRMELVAADAADRLHVWRRSRSGVIKRARPRSNNLPSRVGHSSSLVAAGDTPATALVDDASSAPACEASHPARAPTLDVFRTVASVTPIPSDFRHLLRQQPRAPPAV